MRSRFFTVPLTLSVALVLHIVPLPTQIDLYRPDWVLIVLSYWSMALPNRVNIGSAFLMGLCLDILLGTQLGVHSLVLSISIFVLVANYQRLRNYSVWQQSIIIGLVCSFYHLLQFWVLHLLNDIYFRYEFLLPTLSSMILWPWAFWLLRKIRRQFKVQ